MRVDWSITWTMNHWLDVLPASVIPVTIQYIPAESSCLMQYRAEECNGSFIWPGDWDMNYWSNDIVPNTDLAMHRGKNSPTKMVHFVRRCTVLRVTMKFPYQRMVHWMVYVLTLGRFSQQKHALIPTGRKCFVTMTAEWHSRQLSKQTNLETNIKDRVNLLMTFTCIYFTCAGSYGSPQGNGYFFPSR